jgi:hypothetical protein
MAYTIKQLNEKDSKEYISDKKLLQILIHERINKLTQVYSPLSTRLHELRSKVDNILPENLTPIN